MKTAKEGPHKARTHWQKAQRYARAARANLESGEYDPAVSNAITAIINTVDAVCVLHSGIRSAGESHHESVRLLLSLKDVDPRVRDTLGTRLGALLSVKSLAQYEGELVSRGDAEAAIQNMDRALAAMTGVAKKHGWD